MDEKSTTKAVTAALNAPANRSNDDERNGRLLKDESNAAGVHRLAPIERLHADQSPYPTLLELLNTALGE